MHVGRAYRLIDFAMWSRRSVIYMAVVSVVAVLAYSLRPFAGFTVPWPIVVVLGTTVSLVSGFKNSQVLARSSEALAAFSQIAASSRLLASLCADFVPHAMAQSIVYRHLGWLTALRFALRRPRPWESTSLPANREYLRRYIRIAEDQTTLAAELTALLGSDAATTLGDRQPALDLLHLQARQFNALLRDGGVPPPVYAEFMKVLRDCHDQQARCERIKNTPYPRQYAIVTTMFVAIFCTLLPFGVVPMFAAITIAAIPAALMTWLSVPFSVLLGWMYFSLDLVGESTANPFEGSANDVPLSQICRDIEIELRGRLGETNLPASLPPVRGIAT